MITSLPLMRCLTFLAALLFLQSSPSSHGFHVPYATAFPPSRSRAFTISTPLHFLGRLSTRHTTARVSSSSLSSSSSSSSSLPELTAEEITRYSRHLVLSEVGVLGQRRLKASSVLVIGAGGLGSPCLMYLAAAGVGRIGIVDGDHVSESNLQRQIIHSTSSVNERKVTSSRDTIVGLNPHCTVVTYDTELTSQNALSLFTAETYDLVIDGSDNFPTKYLINDACRLLKLPWIYSAILRFEGQLSVFNYKNGPDYRDFMPVPPHPEDVPSCAEGGVVGVLPGVMGTLQATEAVKVLLGRGEVCSGRVLIWDALKMTFGSVGLEKRKGVENEVTELIDYQGFCRGTMTAGVTTTAEKKEGRTMDEGDDDATTSNDEMESFHRLSPSETLDKLANGWTPYVLDVRLATEHDIVALPFTDDVVPHREVERHHVPKEGDVLVYCKAGVRGVKACRRLIGLGIEGERLFNLEGGIMGWRKEVDQSMPQY